MTVAYHHRQIGFYAGQVTRFGSDLDKTYVNPEVTQQSTVTIVTGAVGTWTTTITNDNTAESVSIDYVGSATQSVVADNLAAAWNASGAAVQLARASVDVGTPTVVDFDHEGEDDYTVVTVEAGAGAATDAIAVAAGSLRVRHGRAVFRTATASITADNFNHIVIATGAALEQYSGVAMRPDGHQQTRDDPQDYFGPGDVPVRDRGSIAVETIGATKPGDAVWVTTAAGVDQGKYGATGDLDVSAFSNWRGVNAAAGVAELEFDLKSK